jgi:quercetin dioxygenase-like cupin family protein
MERDGIRVNPSEEIIRIGPLVIRFLLTGDDTAGKMSVFEFSVPRGERLAAPSHRNDSFEEVLYGVKGVLTWTLGGAPIEVGPGQTLRIPPGVVHSFANHGDEDVTQLTCITPAIMGPDYFREAAEVIRAARGGPPDREQMTEVFRRHGMTLAPHPAAPTA